MTALTQVVSSIQPIDSTQAKPQAGTFAKQWQGILAQTITAATGLFPVLTNLVMQYLPSVEGWITEWTGEQGREIVTLAVTQAEIPLAHGPVSLVIQYLKKSDIFGLEDLEEAAGGKEELRKFLLGEKRYNSEQPLSLDIDDEMQADLSQQFDEEILMPFANIRKVTELYSIYFRPKDITPNIMEQIAKKRGQKFHEYSWKQALNQHGNTAAPTDRWIQFPNDVFGRGKTVQQQQDAGLTFPHFTDAVFCTFMKYVCTRTRILSDAPWTYTRCEEETEGYKLVVGGFGASGLSVDGSFYDSAHYGVAVVRGPVRTLALGPLALGHGH